VIAPLASKALFAIRSLVAVYCSGRFTLSLGVEIMALTIEAVYENGVLKPAQPLPLKEHEKVRITVEVETTWAERTAGMLQWTGDPEVLRRIAEDDEFSILESP
jgi:predicted DNA-binding antitoxin AbrB/MazE fold protein